MYSQDLRELSYSFGPHSLVLFFVLIIHMPQVKGSKKEDPYLNTFIWEQFNLYFINWASLVLLNEF